MKIALLHDYLNQYGGAERVLESLIELFPEAPIYTLIYDKEKTGGRFHHCKIKTSLLDFPLSRKYHRAFIPLMPLAAKTLDLGGKYDFIISDSAGYAKGIAYHDCCTPHISYIHTPLRYAWEQSQYLTGLISNFQFLISKPILNYLKRWDYRAAQKPKVLIANSQFIADKIKKYYNRDAVVIYPPVDTNKFFHDSKFMIHGSNYYLAVGRFLHYKRFDLIIDAFIKLGLPLKIIGSGPEEQKLKIAAKNNNNIEFISFVHNENELRKLYNGAKALVFPQVEDFGLVAAEAQACGTPVIAYAAGGALEIVKDGETGVFFQEQKPESLISAIEKFKKLKFDRKKIADSTHRFSKENFKKMMYNQIQNLMRKM